jgi:hypothetical protein
MLNVTLDLVASLIHIDTHDARLGELGIEIVLVEFQIRARLRCLLHTLG